MKLRLARTVAGRDAVRARALIGEIQAETTTALETLRDLARGIYPPLLIERGIGEALRAHGPGFPFEVRIADAGVGRYPQEVEAAVYFAVLESLQNATKHARASSVLVTVEDQGDELAFSVTDDGVGFDPGRAGSGSGLRNLADRVESVGGSLWVDTAPGRGTTVAGRVPARALEGAGR